MKRLLAVAMVLSAIVALADPSLAQAPNILGNYTIGSGTSSVTGRQWALEVHVTSQNLAGQIGGTVVLLVPRTSLNPTGRITYSFTGTIASSGAITIPYGRFPTFTTLKGIYWERYKPVFVRFLTGSYETWDYSNIPKQKVDWGTFGVSGL